MAAGDERALGELYDRHAATAYALAMAIVGERADAEEVVADAFAQVWRTCAQFDPARGSVPAWLATITRTRALDLLRARGRRARAVDRAAWAAPRPAGRPGRSGVRPLREGAGLRAHAAPAAPPPPALRERVLREARRARPLAARRRPLRPWIGAAASLVLAVAAGLGYW